MIISPTIKNGQPAFSEDDKRLMADFFRQLEGKTVYIQFSKKKFTRTLGQNDRMWAILSFIANEIGDDPESIHEEMKQKFLPRMWKVDEDGMEVEVEKSTTRLTTKEFSLYNDEIIRWASSFHGIVVPDFPKDYL